MVCEMCGNNNIIKQDGVFVCQYCGTKYSVEDAKKLFIEGVVKIDNSDNIEKHITNARRAKEIQDWSEAARYYSMVEENNPTNIEAIFYTSYSRARHALIESDFYNREAAFNVLENKISLIAEYINLQDVEQNEILISTMSNDIFSLVSSNYVYNRTVDEFGIVFSSDESLTPPLFDNVGFAFAFMASAIANNFPEELKTHKKFYLELAIKHAEYILKYGKFKSDGSVEELIYTYHKMINEVDPSHTIPSKPTPIKQDPIHQNDQGEKSGGCYIATAVYGSYDCPEVWTLRRFRDNKLSKIALGRIFIRVYYAVSPTIVKWFGKNLLFKKFWINKLNKLVHKLNEHGYSDTPYSDIEWK